VNIYLTTNYIDNNRQTNVAFTHAGLTTRYRTKSLYKSMFVLLSQVT